MKKLLAFILVVLIIAPVFADTGKMTQEKYEKDQEKIKEALTNVFKDLAAETERLKKEKAKKEGKALKSTRKPLIQILFKEKQPSLETLDKVKEVLKEYKYQYEVQYHNIMEPESAGLIRKLELDTTHFPFGLLIDGKFKAMINGKTVAFCKFPESMHHIGKHPGNWTLKHLKKVLKDNSLLIENKPGLFQKK
jgi:hypothetical protein